MERVGVREVRQNISVYLRRVALGEVFTVTEHGRPVAMLTPVPPDGDPLAALVASGLAEPAKAPWSLPPPSTGAAGERSLSEILQRMRDEDAR